MLRVRTVWALPVVELLQIWNMTTLYSYSSHFALPFIIFSRLVPSNSFGSCYCSPWSPVLHLSQYRYGRIRFGGSLWVIHYQKWFLLQHGQYWWPSLYNWWVLRPVAVRIPVPNSSYRQQYVHSYSYCLNWQNPDYWIYGGFMVVPCIVETQRVDII